MFLAPALLLSLAASAPVPAEFSGVQPQLAAVGQRVVLAFGEGQTLSVVASRDGGRTFSSPVAVPSRGKLALGRHRGPRIAIVGEAIVVTAIVTPEGGAGDLLAWRSIDDGRSWSTPVRLNGVAGSAREGLHGMGGSGNRVATAWLDLRGAGTQLRVATSGDGGVSWSEDRSAYEPPSGTICSCCHPSVAVSPTGDISVLFRNALEGARDMYVATSQDGGGTFGPARRLGNGIWKIEGCPMDGGGVAVDGEGLIGTVWRREKEVFFARPGQPEQLLGTGRDPAVALGRAGAWAVVFRDDDGVSIRDAKSPEVLRLAPGAQAPVLVALDDGSWLAAWERDNHVFVSRVNP